MPDAMDWAAALPKSRSMPTGKNRVRTIIRDGWWTQATLRLRLMATASREFYKLEAKDAQAPQKKHRIKPAVPIAPSQTDGPSQKNFRWISPWHRGRDRQSPCLASESAPLQNLPVMNLSFMNLQKTLACGTGSASEEPPRLEPLRLDSGGKCTIQSDDGKRTEALHLGLY